MPALGAESYMLAVTFLLGQSGLSGPLASPLPVQVAGCCIQPSINNTKANSHGGRWLSSSGSGFELSAFAVVPFCPPYCAVRLQWPSSPGEEVKTEIRCWPTVLQPLD